MYGYQQTAYNYSAYASANANGGQHQQTAAGYFGYGQQQGDPSAAVTAGYQHQKKRQNLVQFFCETCKISCDGEIAYNEHLRGKTHKKREQQQLNKESGSRGVVFRCEVCELTCSSKDADSHVKGQKHQRTVALLRRMGKHVPQQDIGEQSNAVQAQPTETVGSSAGGPLKMVVGVTGTKFVGGTTLLTAGEEFEVGACMPPPAPFQMTQQPPSRIPMARNLERMDDKHVMKKLQEIQLDANDMRNIERLASLVEKTLKEVSDALTKSAPLGEQQTEQQRTLQGVMRVGELAKQLMLKTDKQIELVVFCSKIPTVTLLKEVAELFKKHAEVKPPNELTVVDKVQDSAIYVTLSGIDVTSKVTLTSVLLREGNHQQLAATDTPTDPLPNGPCLNALAEVRRAKFYQVKCAPLLSMNSTVKIIRDISQRVRTWSLMSSWVIELLVERTLASVAVPLSPGDAVRRFFEVLSSGVLIGKRAKLLDPCEQEQFNALGYIYDQEREDITASAQHALRLIAYNQIYKILGIDRLPDPLPLGANQPREGAKTGVKRRADGSAAHGNEQGEAVLADDDQNEAGPSTSVKKMKK